jgi:hypothetical protein
MVRCPRHILTHTPLQDWRGELNASSVYCPVSSEGESCLLGFACVCFALRWRR